MRISIFDSSPVGRREQWLSSKQPDETRNAYIAASGRFTKELKIVAGEANGKLFNRAEFVESIESVLREHTEATFKFVFHKKASIDEARQHFAKDNGRLLALRGKYPEQVHFYWAPSRPEQHYAVIDEESVILEQPHHLAGKPFWATIIRDSDVATGWEKYFNEYVSFCSPMEF